MSIDMNALWPTKWKHNHLCLYDDDDDYNDIDDDINDDDDNHDTDDHDDDAIIEKNIESTNV